MFTNINISNSTEQFKYVVEYKKTLNQSYHSFADGVTIKSTNEYIDDILFDYDLTSHFKHNGHWYPINSNTQPNIKCLNGIIRLYFPDFSVDTYHSGHKYAFEVCTWIRDKRIVLGSHIISRTDALMCPNSKRFFNENYYECIEIPIVDPYELMYSDSWSSWRKEYCNELQENINSVGSVLYCTLYPVEESSSNEYIKIDGYEGGQSYINLTSNNDDFFHLEIEPNVWEKLDIDEQPSILFNLKFNDSYNGDLRDYLYETYGITNGKIRYELVIGNESKEDIYAICTSEIMDLTSSYKFTKSDINKDNFDNGNGWVSGISIMGSVEVLDESEKPVLYLLSNSIPFTEDLFKYFVKTDFIDRYGYIINNVNLSDVNMDLLNINTVNKTENKIITIDKNVGDKVGVTQFVFYRTVDLPSINIRPQVNENICINLDQYKHLVKSFILQIEGVKFIEIGRTKSGVVFKVIGNKLPKQIQTGQYYILNQDSDLVTSGKYTYEV